MTQAQTDAVVIEVRIEARPEIVFPYFTDPEKLLRWKGIEAELDPRPGGIYRVNINGRDTARGEFVEVSAPTRVVFTWGWEAEGSELPPGASTVEVTLRADGAGTVVTLRHSGLAASQQGEHAEGWNHFLSRLAIVAAGGDPGPDPWAAGEGG